MLDLTREDLERVLFRYVEEHRQEVAPDTGTLGDYLSGIFVDQVRSWNVFSVEKLTRAEQFLRVV